MVVEEGPKFEVLELNWESVTAFLACETQWQVLAPFGGPLIWLGLDYLRAEVVLRRRNAPDAVFGDLQIMEKAAIGAFVEVSGD